MPWPPSSAALLAAPAFAEETIKVDLTGKAPAAKFAILARAAKTVCHAEPGMDIYNVFSRSGCVRTTIAAAIDKLGDAGLAKYAAEREAFLTLASAD